MFEKISEREYLKRFLGGGVSEGELSKFITDGQTETLAE